MILHDIITTQQDPELGSSLRAFVADKLAEFKAVVKRHDGSALGGISNAEVFWLYFLIKAIRPTQIIESGTFHGYSLYFIVEAVDWPCRIISFDLDLQHTPRYNGVEYCEHDWMEYTDGLQAGDGTLVFFDDHIDHDRRLAEAVVQGQQHIVFHDNYLRTDQSHRSVRFCDLRDAWFCYTFPAIYSDPVFTDTEKNAQTYRWLTYMQR